MSILQTREVSNRKDVMDLLDRHPFAFLANAARPFHDILSGLLPSDAVGSWRSSLPARMGCSFVEFRLPFSHAGARAKRFDGMEVGSGSAKVLKALDALLCDSIAPTKVRFSHLRCDTTGERTKLLVSLPCSVGRFPAYKADRHFRHTPTIQQITFWRAKTLLRPAVVRMKGLSALYAVTRLLAFHVRSLTQIEEKYCEIAARRLGQEVLAL